MKKISSFLLLALSILACSAPTATSEIGTVSIIPMPTHQLIGDGFFEIKKGANVDVEEEAQAKIMQLVFPSLQTTVGGKSSAIKMMTDSAIPAEGYHLQVTTEGILLKANSDAGFFYGLQSLKQLMPLSFFTEAANEMDAWKVPAVVIEDAPAFGWRGYMLDVSRHFFEVAEVKKVIDFMAESKLNRFHWHLTDDQGWRVEIKSFPKLTTVGAWRVDYTNRIETKSDWWGRPFQKEGEQATYGGFYTQEDIKEIIAYAKERFIEVIPEIDMPGHAQATIAAYPEIGCVNAAPFVATGGAYQNNTYNPGKEATFEFSEKMLNEIMDLFPYDYIHIGGDECNKNQWKIDPYAQQRMKAEGLSNVEELQSYFIRRIEKIINARGRIMIGWDEILEGGLAPNAVVMSWRGAQGGITSAKAGHEVIMTPSEYCYLDLKQGHDDLEPNLGYSESLLSAAYHYQIIPDSLTEVEGKLIKGIQGNLWTESISDWGKLTYMTFPRLYAIAENGWTTQKDKDWDHFTNRLSTQFDRLDAQNIRYAVSAFSPWIDHKGDDGKIEISLKTEVNNLRIHYTLDGTTPSLESTIYKTPFTVKESVQLRARAFQAEQAVGYISALDFPIHLAANKRVIDKNGESLPKLTDLNYGKLTTNDKAWQRFADEMEVIIAFEERTEVKAIHFDALRFTISGIYPPKKVAIFGSMDGKEFNLLGELDQLKESLEQGRNKVKSKISFTPIEVKFLKIKGYSHQPLKEGHHRAGQNSVIAIDELVVL